MCLESNGDYYIPSVFLLIYSTNKKQCKCIKDSGLQQHGERDESLCCSTFYCSANIMLRLTLQPAGGEQSQPGPWSSMQKAVNHGSCNSRQQPCNVTGELFTLQFPKCTGEQGEEKDGFYWSAQEIFTLLVPGA